MNRKFPLQLATVILMIGSMLSSQAQSHMPLPNINDSCQPYFDKNKIKINYKYADLTQTHDYSGNWDFDGDLKTDELYFIGTGGAHLYFYLRVILSSDKKVRDFPFIGIDMPCVGTADELKKSSFYPPPLFPQFVVDLFYVGKMGVTDKIYLHLDSYSEIPKAWKKQGVTSNYVLLLYENGDMIIKNFVD
jgi:hypothetical protein